MEYYVTFSDGSSAYLEHFGVKGMHWGVWNAETRARRMGGGTGAKRKGSSGESSSTSSSGRHLTDKQKKMLKGAAIGIGTAAAIGGGVYLARTGKLKQLNAIKNDAIASAKEEHRAKAAEIRNKERAVRKNYADTITAMARNNLRKTTGGTTAGGNDIFDTITSSKGAKKLIDNRVRSDYKKMGSLQTEKVSYNSGIDKNLHQASNYIREGRRILKSSRLHMNAKIDYANFYFDEGKRKVNKLTAIGALGALAAGSGAGVGYYKKSTSKTKRSSVKKRK